MSERRHYALLVDGPIDKRGTIIPITSPSHLLTVPIDTTSYSDYERDQVGLMTHETGDNTRTEVWRYRHKRTILLAPTRMCCCEADGRHGHWAWVRDE